MDETATRHKKIASALYGAGWEQRINRVAHGLNLLLEGNNRTCLFQDTSSTLSIPGKSLLSHRVFEVLSSWLHVIYVWCKDNAFSRFGQTISKEYLPKQHEKHLFKQVMRNKRAKHVLQNIVSCRVRQLRMNYDNYGNSFQKSL